MLLLLLLAGDACVLRLLVLHTMVFVFLLLVVGLQKREGTVSLLEAKMENENVRHLARCH